MGCCDPPRCGLNFSLRIDTTGVTYADLTGDGRADVITGAGRAFCAGFDLKENAEGVQRGVVDWRAILERDLAIIMRFWRSPLPTLAAVKGYAIAGGSRPWWATS